MPSGPPKGKWDALHNQVDTGFRVQGKMIPERKSGYFFFWVKVKDTEWQNYKCQLFSLYTHSSLLSPIVTEQYPPSTSQENLLSLLLFRYTILFYVPNYGYMSLRRNINFAGRLGLMKKRCYLSTEFLKDTRNFPSGAPKGIISISYLNLLSLKHNF